MMATKKGAQLGPSRWDFTQSEIAEIFGVTPAAIIKWDLPAKELSGKKWYDIRLAGAKRREITERKAGGQGAGLTAARVREANARAEKVRMQTAILRGESIPRKVVEGVWSDKIQYLAQAAATTDTRAARVICEQHGIVDQRSVEKIIRQFLDEALERMSEYNPDEYLARMGAVVDMGEESDGPEETGEN